MNEIISWIVYSLLSLIGIVSIVLLYKLYSIYKKVKETIGMLKQVETMFNPLGNNMKSLSDIFPSQAFTLDGEELKKVNENDERRTE